MSNNQSKHFVDPSFLWNPLIDTDSYKPSHYKQLPPGASYVESYMEPRRGDWVIWMGYQPIVRTLLSTRITKEMVEEAELMWNPHCGQFNKEGWMIVVNEYNGYIPIEVWAAPEGMVIPCKKSTMRVSCSDPRLLWLVQWLETPNLRVWNTSNVASRSRKLKMAIQSAFNRSSDDPNQHISIKFKLHDFGSRGCSSPMSAALAGMGHLVNFWGSDTGVAIAAIKKFYDFNGMPAFSIAASEHGTMTPWINMNDDPLKGEVAAYQHMIDQFGDSDIFACVSDSRDIENAVANIWGDVLRDQVLSMKATLVIRPDSGDPIEWLPKLLNIAADKFGYTTNSKGYKVINKVRFIQGDGITDESLPLILKAVMDAGFSIDNLAFGMGGGLLQMHNRDTYGWAMKVSYMVIDGKGVHVFKDPASDPGKKSKSGMIRLYKSRLTNEFIEFDISTGLKPDETEFEEVHKLVYKMTKGMEEPEVHLATWGEVCERVAKEFGEV